MEWLRKCFVKGAVFERAGIPCLIWVGVFTLILNHWLYPFISLSVAIKPVPLPDGYWDAIPWIIGAIMGKKVGDKFITMRELDNPEGRPCDGNRDKSKAEYWTSADITGESPPGPKHS